MLPDQSDIVRFYTELAEESGSPSRLLSDGAALPPFLCRALAFGDARPALADCTWAEAMTGSASGEVREIRAGEHRVYWAACGVAAWLGDVIPVDGYAPAAPTAVIARRLEEALCFLKTADEAAASSASAFIGAIVWLERVRGGDGPGLTSSSFPELPHLVSFTEGATLELLPNCVLSAPSPCALAENLYHESLHQQLSAAMLMEDLLAEDYDARTSPKVAARWRGAEWPVDRALHALFVYTRLLPVRRAYLDAGMVPRQERDGVAQALREAEQAADSIIEPLAATRRCFTPRGEEVLDAVIAERRRS